MVRRLTGVAGWALASALLLAGCSDNAAGKALVDELEAIRLRGMERVLTRMAAAERRQVLTGLEALVDAAASVPEDEAHSSKARRTRK